MAVDPKPILATWPTETREAAQLVVNKYGYPDEATESMLIWNERGPWKKTVAFREAVEHHFPIPHKDSVEQFIDYKVPVDKFSDIASFDGSVVTERTAGIASARCHDEEANSLALNLMNDIVNGTKSVEEAREYYAHEFLAYRRKEPTPYMQSLRFSPQPNSNDPDERMLSDEDVMRAFEEGKRKENRAA